MCMCVCLCVSSCTDGTRMRENSGKGWDFVRLRRQELQVLVADQQVPAFAQHAELVGGSSERWNWRNKLWRVHKQENKNVMRNSCQRQDRNLETFLQHHTGLNFKVVQSKFLVIYSVLLALRTPWAHTPRPAVLLFLMPSGPVATLIFSLLDGSFPYSQMYPNISGKHWGSSVSQDLTLNWCSKYYALSRRLISLNCSSGHGPVEHILPNPPSCIYLVHPTLLLAFSILHFLVQLVPGSCLCPVWGITS